MPQKPKVLFDQHKQARDDQAKSSQKPRVLFGVEQDLLPKSTAPKVLAGSTLRKRMPCDLETLSAQNPSVSAGIIRAALEIIHSVNLDDPHFEDIVRFGEDLQIEHSQISEAELNIANDEQLGQTHAILSRTLGIIKQLDPEKAFGLSESVFKKISTLVLSAATPREVFDEHYPQLLEQIQQLKIQEALLVKAQRTLKSIKPRYNSLIKNINSYIIAAEFMTRFIRQTQHADGLNEHFTAQASALDNRATSLLNTQSTLAMGSMTHQALNRNVDTLKATIQSIIYEDLPAFHTAYTAALASLEPIDASITPLRRIYLKLIDHLNGEKP